MRDFFEPHHKTYTSRGDQLHNAPQHEERQQVPCRTSLAKPTQVANGPPDLPEASLGEDDDIDAFDNNKWHGIIADDPLMRLRHERNNLVSNETKLAKIVDSRVTKHLPTKQRALHESWRARR